MAQGVNSGLGCSAEFSSCVEDSGIGGFIEKDTKTDEEEEEAEEEEEEDSDGNQQEAEEADETGSAEETSEESTIQEGNPGADEAGFSASIGRYSAAELNEAAITVFGEISSVLPENIRLLWEEAWAVASVIFNRSDAILNGTAGTNPFGSSASLIDVSTAGNGAQFHGNKKGHADIKRGVNFKNEMNPGQRNRIRLFYAIQAVNVIARGGSRANFLFFVSNFSGSRTLKQGQYRYGGNDFSVNPISLK